MDHKEITGFREKLIEMRKFILERMGSTRSSEREESAKEKNGDHSSYSFHMADQGSDALFQEEIFLGIERESSLLYEIEEALNRIDNGTYGLCTSCGQPVGGSRLEALPYASLCVHCKSKDESVPVPDGKTDRNAFHFPDGEDDIEADS